MDISVELAGLELKNPIVLASGTAGYGDEIAGLLDVNGVGAVILKSVTVEPCAGNPAPRIWETTAGMLNSIGLENMGMEALVEEVLPALRDIGSPVIASIAGSTIREFARMAARISKSDVVRGIEINVSCPNVERGGIQFGVDAGATTAVVTAVKENTGLPLFVKLSAAVTDITSIARAAGEAGAAGLSLINTVPGLAVDAAGRRSRLGAVTGGLSGPAIKPIALKAVRDCYRATGLPIIGGGGVLDEEDVLEFMVAGSTAVSVGTATFSDPALAGRIADRLPKALERIGAGSARELTGTLRE